MIQKGIGYLDSWGIFSKVQRSKQAMWPFIGAKIALDKMLMPL